MIIDQLPLLAGNALTTDEIPIERGVTTYKATLLQALGSVFDTIEPNFADAYDKTATYSVGDYVIYENSLYKCNTAILTAEEWDATHWTQVNVAEELLAILSAVSTKQDKITASGILKGSGAGIVSAAVAGTDYLTPATSYSPIKAIGALYAIVASDIGKTLRVGYALRNTEVTITLDQTVSSSIPVGAEIAFINDFKSTILLATNGVRVNYPGSEYSTDNGYSSNAAHSFRVSERFSMCALKKMENASANGDLWGIIGNVEVVT